MAGRPRAPARLPLVAAVLVMTLAMAASGLARPAPAQAATSAAAAAMRLRLNAWHYAVRQHGKPYQWGGTGPGGFDCSGLVYVAYRSRGVALPRTTHEMVRSWHLVRIRKSQARRGDLAFFGSGHVELFDHGTWTFGAEQPGTSIGWHRMNRWWHPTMYFRVRRRR